MFCLQRGFLKSVKYTNEIKCISSVSHTWSPSLCSHKKGQSSQKENIQRIPYFGISVGLCISYGFYKYFLRERERYYKRGHSWTLFSNSFTLKAISLSGEKGDQPDSARSKFNFIADIAEKISPSVVYIEIQARHPLAQRFIAISNGSGFIIKPDGLILTNAHVVANQQTVTVKLHDGREFKGVVEDVDAEADLATVRIKANDLPVLQLGPSSKVRVGEFVIAMGNPLTLSHTITAGVISSAHRPSKELGLHAKADYIQTDAAINIGNSGGPLVNLDGEVIGINTMKVTEGISFAIPSDRAAEFLKQSEDRKATGWQFFKGKKDTETVRRKYIGITMLTLTPQLIQELQQRSPDFPLVQHGVLVWRVTIGSPAHEADIKPGDIITSINGTKVSSSADIYKFLAGDDELRVTVIRGSKQFHTVVHPQGSVTS